MTPMHPFHRMMRRSAVLSASGGAWLILLAAMNEATGLVGGRGWTIVAAIGAACAFLGAAGAWWLRDVPLVDEAGSPRSAMGAALAVTVVAAAVGAVLSYVFSGWITAVIVGVLILVSGSVGAWRGAKMVAKWPR